MANRANLNITTITKGRSSNLSECSSSSSSFSDHEDYSQINGGVSKSRKWKKLMRKMVEGSKRSIYGSSKPMIFHYDAVSYSLNFDEGNYSNQHYTYGSRCSQVLSDYSKDQF